MSTTGVGFQIEYPAITLHAVSRGEAGPSIYCQLDESFGQLNGGPTSANEDENTEMRELTIVPKNSDSCMSCFLRSFLYSSIFQFLFLKSGAHF